MIRPKDALTSAFAHGKEYFWEPPFGEFSRGLRAQVLKECPTFQPLEFTDGLSRSNQAHDELLARWSWPKSQGHKADNQ